MQRTRDCGVHTANRHIYGIILVLKSQGSGNTLRARGPWCLLWDSVFYIWGRGWGVGVGSHTHGLSTIWLPNQTNTVTPPADRPMWMGKLSQGHTPRRRETGSDWWEQLSDRLFNLRWSALNANASTKHWTDSTSDRRVYIYIYIVYICLKKHISILNLEYIKIHLLEGDEVMSLTGKMEHRTS